MAYGMAGATALGELSQARELVDGLLNEGRLSVEWPDAERNPALQPGWGRLLINLAAAAAESLPRGGVLTLEVDDSGAGVRLVAAARGDRARIEESTRAVYFEGAPVDDLTPRSVHSYFTVKLAQNLGGRIEVAEDADREVRFEAHLP
jgi:histidine phosphotransferase ChpT